MDVDFDHSAIKAALTALFDILLFRIINDNAIIRLPDISAQRLNVVTQHRTGKAFVVNADFAKLR